MGFLEQVPVRDGLVVCAPYLTGSFLDCCGHTVTPPLGGHWVSNSERDGWVASAADSRITYADSPDLRLGAMSVHWWGDHNKHRDTSRILCKGDAGTGVNYEVYLTGGGQIWVSDGTNDSLRNDTPLGHFSLTITSLPGKLPLLYSDGGYFGPFTLAVNFPQTDAPLHIGGHWTDNEQWDNPLSGLLLYNRALTATEITTLHAWSLTLRSVRRNWAGSEYKGDQIFADNIQHAIVSSEDEAGTRLSNTDYLIHEGTFRVKQHDTGEKYIECITDGLIYRRNLEAYGTWMCEWYKMSPSNLRASLIKSDIPQAIGTGYYWIFGSTESIQLYELGVGIKFTGGQFDALTRIKAWMTRERSAGKFTGYVKGGRWHDWHEVGDQTDNTTTTSQYVSFEMDSGDRLYADRQWISVREPV